MTERCWCLTSFHLRGTHRRKRPSEVREGYGLQGQSLRDAGRRPGDWVAFGKSRRREAGHGFAPRCGWRRT